MVPTLETARLRLRGFRESDLAPWASAMADPEVVRHIGGEPFDREGTWRRMLCAGGLWSVFGYGYWAVERREDGVLVGQLGYADFKRDMQPSIEGIPEIGWIFAPHGQGQGLCAEAVGAALAWADETLRAPEIVAIIAPANAPSIRVAERSGFVRGEETLYRGEPTLIFRRRIPA